MGLNGEDERGTMARRGRRRTPLAQTVPALCPLHSISKARGVQDLWTKCPAIVLITSRDRQGQTEGLAEGNARLGQDPVQPGPAMRAGELSQLVVAVVQG